MDVKITNEQAQSQFPELVSELMSRLRKGTSIHKNADVKDITFIISVAERIEMSNPFTRSASGNTVKTKDEIVQSRVANSSCVLRASIGRWRSSILIEGEVPQPVIDKYAELADSQIAERNRVSSLTKEERDKEIQESIRILSKSPGFAIFGFKSK